jgi:hypothetical protein
MEYVSKDARTLLYLIKEKLTKEKIVEFHYISDLRLIVFSSMLGENSYTIPPKRILSGYKMDKAKERVKDALNELVRYDLVVLQERDGRNEIYGIKHPANIEVDKINFKAIDELELLYGPQLHS